MTRIGSRSFALRRIALLCIGFASASAASAALVSTGIACDAHATEMTSQTGFIACSGSWSGNNSNQLADLQAQAMTDWGLTLSGPTDVTSSAGSELLTFAPEKGVFVISLKAGDAFSLYEFNGADVVGGISSIDFDTLGVGFISGHGSKSVVHFGQDLSHADLYVAASVVPEPSGIALLLAGLGGMALVSRRRSRAS